MVDIREEGDGKALFTTKEYIFGDVILAETPLIAISRSKATANDIARFLRALKVEFDEISKEAQAAALSLFCPHIEELRKNGIYLFAGFVVDYATVHETASRICENEEDAADLTNLFCIWKYNATQYQGTKTALFEMHARINHSCRPNAVFLAGTVRAVNSISPGEMLTISYLPNERLIASTYARRQELLSSYRFHCQCNRCAQTVDRCRTMRCPSCSRCSAVWGLSLAGDSQDVAASCISCKTSHNHYAMPLAEEATLSREVQRLQSSVTSYESIHELQERVLDKLGANHWAAATLMELRYKNDPMINGFIVMQWGEAYAQWCSFALPDARWLYYIKVFALGDGCRPHIPHEHGQKGFEYAGRRYWKECYDSCKKLWGEDDPDVQNMDLMFARCRAEGSKADVSLCTYLECTRPIEDRLGRNDPKLKCKACGLAQYCNKECQRADWQEHKVVCKVCRALRDLQDVKKWAEDCQVN